LSSLLREQGAVVFEVPTIRIVPLADKIRELAEALDHILDYSWLILTSVNTTGILQEVLQEKNRTWTLFGNLRIACIGTATAERVKALGGTVALIPSRFQAEGLVDEMIQAGIASQKILLPRAQGSREILPRELEKLGAAVHEIHVYRAELPETSRAELLNILRTEQVDYITFTSSSTVRNFMEMAVPILSEIDLSKTRIACIGPITAATLKEYGLPVSIQADEFTIPGLVKALKNYTM